MQLGKAFDKEFIVKLWFFVGAWGRSSELSVKLILLSVSRIGTPSLGVGYVLVRRGLQVRLNTVRA